MLSRVGDKLAHLEDCQKQEAAQYPLSRYSPSITCIWCTGCSLNIVFFRRLKCIPDSGLSRFPSGVKHQLCCSRTCRVTSFQGKTKYLMNTLYVQWNTGYSENFGVSQKFSIHRKLLVIKKNPANDNDCKLKSLARMSCCPDSCIKGMVCILLGKTLNFSVTPCSM